VISEQNNPPFDYLNDQQEFIFLFESSFSKFKGNTVLDHTAVISNSKGGHKVRTVQADINFIKSI